MTTLGPWVKGLVNSVSVYAIPQDGLAVADNVDIDRDGVATSRSTYGLLDSANYSSLIFHNGTHYAVRDNEFGVASSNTFKPLSTVSGSVDYTTLNGSLVVLDNDGCFIANPDTISELPVGTYTQEEADEFQLKPMPGGQFVEYYRGRLFVARGTTLYWSEPMHYGVYSATRNFLRLGERIQWVVALETCLYIGLTSSVVYILGTEPDKFTVTKVGGVSAKGVATRYDTPYTDTGKTTVALWFTETGIAVGDQQGMVSYPQADRLKRLPLHSGKMVVENDRVYIFTTKES